MEGHKVLPSDILHKSDIGGVCLGESDRAAAETAFDEILAASFAAEPDAAIDGCLVAPMVTGGVETILGVQRDPRARRFATTPVMKTDIVERRARLEDADRDLAVGKVGVGVVSVNFRWFAQFSTLGRTRQLP